MRAWNLRGRAQGLVGFDLYYAACPLPDRVVGFDLCYAACPLPDRVLGFGSCLDRLPPS